MTKQTQITYKEFDSNLATDLVNNLHPPSKKFGATSVRKYYQQILDLLPSKFNFSVVSENLVLKLLNDMIRRQPLVGVR